MYRNNVQQVYKLKDYRQRYKVLLLKEVWPFAWPIFIELLCVVLMSMVSTILVSRLGANNTAAIGISDSMTYIVFSVLSAIALGGSVLVAQSYGRRQSENAGDQARQSINLNLLISLIFLVVIIIWSAPILEVLALGAEEDVLHLSETYLKTISFSYPAIAITLAGCAVLRAVGNTKVSMQVNIAANLLNVFYSYPLIYGFGAWEGWGLLGAGLGEVLARWSGVVITLFYLKKNITLAMPIRGYFRAFTRKTLFDILGIGVPSSVESLMFNVGKLITIMMVAGMGTISMAGSVIAFSIMLLINIPGNTLGMTSTILVAKRLGQGRPKSATQELKMIFWLANGLLIGATLILIPFVDQAISLYTTNPEVVDVVKTLLYMNFVMMPLWAASFVLPAAFKGAKDAKYTMWVAIFSMWGCRICCGYALGIMLDWGVYGIWIGMFCDWIIRGGIFYYRMQKNGWLKKYYATPANVEKLQEDM
ncbi:MAG: EmmdR/YeeO family multidrug/toxin efflux MATE transporter [Vibrio sp.]